MSKDETEEENRRKTGGKQDEKGGKQEENRVCSDVDLWLRTANVYTMVRD